MKTIKKVLFYRTKCQFIATSLYSQGAKINTTERLNGEIWFVFENEERCKKIVKKYFNGELRVCPKLLFNSFKDIKSLIYA